jgi:chromosome segregation ATPase
MSELGERVSSAESSFTEAQDSIREVKEHVDDVEGKTSTGLKEMFDRIARSEVRNNERIEKQGLDHERLSRQVGKVEQKWRSRINDTIAKMEDLEKMVETQDSSIQELKAQNNSLSRQLQQQRQDMQAFQRLTEDRMAAYATHVALIESQMDSKMESHAKQTNDRVYVLKGQMAARAREASQHKAQTDVDITEMKREFTSRLEMMQEKFLERVQDLEKKHYGRIRKLEGKLSEQQGHIDRCDAVVPALFKEGQELRGFCEEFRESLVDLSGQIATVSAVQEKKGHKSRKPLGVLEQHNGNVQREEQRSRKTSAAP